MRERTPTVTNSDSCSASASPALARIPGTIAQTRTRIMTAAPYMRKAASLARSVGTCVSEGAMEP